jgi:hypothetical protein
MFLTYLIYLPPLRGCIYFPRLNHLCILPFQGMTLIFFRATIYEQLNPMALHAAGPALDTTKNVSRIWIRQGPHQRVELPASLNYSRAASIINSMPLPTTWSQSHTSQLIAFSLCQKSICLGNLTWAFIIISCVHLLIYWSIEIHNSCAVSLDWLWGNFIFNFCLVLKPYSGAAYMS